MGTTNRDMDTGIRFGVIPQHDCLQAWADESESIYPCEECESWDSENEECDDEGMDCEPVGYKYVNDEYKLFAGSDGDIFVEKSPFFTYAAFCSPCAPGACHLRNPLEHTADEHEHAMCKFPISNPSPLVNNKCYCLGHDWFYDCEPAHAPYPVYEVATGKRVYPEQPAPEIEEQPDVDWLVRICHMTDESTDIRVDIKGKAHFMGLDPNEKPNAEEIAEFIREILETMSS